MKVKTKIEFPYKLRIFEDGKIKSRGLVILSGSDFSKYVKTLKTCLDCGTNLIEYKPYNYQCPRCGETFSWGFNTLQRDIHFYQKHTQYKEGDNIPIKESKKVKSTVNPNSLKKIQIEYPKAYTEWTAEDELYLESEFKNGKSIDKIAQVLQRKPGGIKARLIKLGLIEDTKST